MIYYLLICLITAFIVGWEYRKKSYLIFIMGFVMCPMIILCKLSELILNAILYLKRKVKTDK